jgi:phytoene dehydrogenase-like protein
VRDVEAILIDSPVMKLNLAIEDLPCFAALDAPGTEQRWGQTGGVFIGPSIDYLQRAYEDARNGRPSDHPLMSVHMQSALDPSVAPPGKHTLSIFTQYFPYRLAEGTWDERREAIADAVMARFAEYAPNIANAVVARQTLAPPDIEARFGLTGGHIFQGETMPDQMWEHRLTPRTPVAGLYLCGAATHPAGSVIALNGRNAAMAVLGDTTPP